MTQPAAYVRAFNFGDYQASNPTTPLPGLSVDEEYSRIKVTLDQIRANLAIIQRDDTALASESVGFDQLKDEVTLGVNAPTTWVTAHAYIVNDTVFNSQKFYRCLVSHTSGTFATDLAAAKWVLIADFTLTQSALGISYDNTTSQLVATNVQAAVDEVAAAQTGSSSKPVVRAATTANITLSGAQTIDGVSVVAGDRVLVWKQSTASQNGIWVAASGGWSRAVDMNTWAKVPGARVWVSEGTANGDSTLVCTNDAGGTLGSTSIVFTPPSLRMIARTVYTGGGTHTFNTSTKVARLIAQAGGGGGGGAAIGGAGGVSAGSGGGGGGYEERWLSAGWGATETITVGAAGTAGANTGGTGGDGGASSVGTLCVAAGGTGGGGMATRVAADQRGTAAPGNGGVGSGAGGTAYSGSSTIRVNGSYGTWAKLFGVAATALGGVGGNSFMGAGGLERAENVSGAPGLGYGGGGSGGCAASSAQTGGTGAAGVVIIEEFVYA